MLGLSPSHSLSTCPWRCNR